MSQSTLDDFQSSGIECPTCGEMWETEALMKNHHANKHGEIISGQTVCCEWCGNDLHRTKFEVGRSERFFCNRTCQGSWRAENEDGWSQDANRVECDWCGELHPKPPSEVSEYNFCDRDHMGEWLSENRSGEDHPNHKGKRAVNPVVRQSEWWDQYRESVRERDGYRCWYCGLPETYHKAIWGQELHVHHVEPRSEYENDVQATYEGNLLANCQFCHKRLDVGLEGAKGSSW